MRYRMPSTPYTLVPILLALSYAVQVSADPTDSFPNITLAPPRHQLAKRDSYANLQVQWPDKTLMYMASEDKHWWSDEPWASGWFYTPGHTGTIDPVTVMFYEGGYDWKRNHATAQATVSCLIIPGCRYDALLA